MSTDHEMLQLARLGNAACETKNAQIERLGTALEKLIKEYRSERDDLYNAMTNAAGEYSAPNDERSVKEMDAVLNEATAAMAGTIGSLKEADHD